MKILKYVLFLACVIPIFIFRDYTPNNELKYLSIADEAIRNGNIFTFSNQGMVYADKPPLYLWIVMLGKYLLGGHSMLFLGLFSFIPALVTLFVMDKWIGNTVDKKIRLSGQLMLLTSGLFLGSAIVLRMDMLMCMFIVLSLYTFFKIYSGRYSNVDKFLFPFYIFMAIFSKGPIGLVVPLLSVTTFLIVKKEIRDFGKYLGWKEFGLLLGLSAIWFGGVYLEGGNEYLHNLLFNQTVNRAVDSFHHKAPFYYYATSIWYALAPWSVFYIITIIVGIKKRLIQTDLEKFFLVIITTTFIALSVFSGKLDIYMLPAFPFFAYLALLILFKLKEKLIVNITIAIPAAAILLAALPAMSFMDFHHNLFIVAATTVLSVSALGSLIYLFKNHLHHSINSLAIGMLLTIFVGSFAIPDFNEQLGFRKLAETGEKLATESGIQNYYSLGVRSAENMDVFLQKEVVKTDIETIDKLIGQGQEFILFARSRELSDGKPLVERVKDREQQQIGDQVIIVFRKQ